MNYFRNIQFKIVFIESEKNNEIEFKLDQFLPLFHCTGGFASIAQWAFAAVNPDFSINCLAC